MILYCAIYQKIKKNSVTKIIAYDILLKAEKYIEAL